MVGLQCSYEYIGGAVCCQRFCSLAKKANTLKSGLLNYGNSDCLIHLPLSRLLKTLAQAFAITYRADVTERPLRRWLNQLIKGLPFSRRARRIGVIAQSHFPGKAITIENLNFIRRCKYPILTASTIVCFAGMGDKVELPIGPVSHHASAR